MEASIIEVWDAVFESRDFIWLDDHQAILGALTLPISAMTIFPITSPRKPAMRLLKASDEAITIIAMLVSKPITVPRALWSTYAKFLGEFKRPSAARIGEGVFKPGERKRCERNSQLIAGTNPLSAFGIPRVPSADTGNSVWDSALWVFSVRDGNL